MSKVSGSSIQVLPDLVTNTILIRLPGDGVSVQTEEVIHRLASEKLAERTRRRIREIVGPHQLEGDAIGFRLHFTEDWQPFYELDALDAIGGLCAERRELSCV